MPDKPADTSKPDDGAPTTSTSATDASTTEGAKAAGVTQPQPQRIILESPEPAPEVHYEGVVGAVNPDRPPVQAKYEPFGW